MRTVAASVRGHTVTIERPDPLVIWLDTWVVHGFMKQEAGATVDPRVARLGEAIRAAVSAGRAIVVAGAEEEEIFSADWRDFRRTQLGLTRERAFKDQLTVHRAEFEVAMAAWAKDARSFTVPLDLPYTSETFRTEAEQPDFYVSVSGGSEEAERRAGAALRGKTAADVEALRAQHRLERRKFRDVVDEELRTGATWPVRTVVRHERGEASDVELQLAVEAIAEYAAVARAVNRGTPADWMAFVESETVLARPSGYVFSVLWADMVTGSEPVKGGDNFDTHHLRLAVPYADIIVTDKRMANRIRSRKLDVQFSSAVYCINDLDALTSRLKGTE